MQTVVVDTEVYKDYFVVMFKNIKTGNVKAYEFHDNQPLDINSVKTIISTYCTIGFNSRNYDLPIIYLALAGAKNGKIKAASDDIIVKGLKYCHIEEKYKFKISKDINHIDLIEVAPGKASLKAYGGRIHAKKLQDLPIDPSASISPEDRETLKLYCANDLDLTQSLHDSLLPQIQLREKMGKEYGQDLRSKSDAQLAEAVIKSQVYKLTGDMPMRPVIQEGTEYKYRAPNFIFFKGEYLKNILEDIKEAIFIVGKQGKITLPVSLDKIISIGKSEYKMGIGGLHSCEKSIAHIPQEGEIIIDRDVAGYYPAIILKCGLYPEHMGEDFLTVYNSIVRRRLEAKRIGDKVTSDSLKICVNGSYGKLGSMWSCLYAPDLMIQTTITGQLALLMLIEALEEHGIDVISANTDGVVFKTRDEELATVIIKWWEEKTGFQTEETTYKGLYSKDVNNFIALKNDGGVKLKGQYALPSFMKNPANEISTESVVSFLSNGKDIEKTIKDCTDIRKFIALRSVKGGAVKDGVYLGKTVRWYYSTSTTGTINYKLNGYIVARTKGAKPIMELPENFPDDVDYNWYIAEAQSVLADIGYEDKHA